MDLLTEPDLSELDEESQEQVRQIATQLATNSLSDARLSDLYRLKTACENAIRLADEDPAAARRLVPHLGAVLAHEQAPVDEAAVDRLLRAGLREDIQLLAIDAIADLAGPSLVDRYQSTDHGLERLISAVAYTVTTTPVQRAQQAGIHALGDLCWVRPATVADTLFEDDAIPGVAEAVGAVITDTEPDDKGPLQLFVALATRYPDCVPASNMVKRGIQTAAAGDTVFQSAAADIVAMRTAVPLSETIATASHHASPAERLINQILEPTAQSADAPPQDEWTVETWVERRATAQALGHIVALGETAGRPIPQPFIDSVRETTGRERRRAAETLGYLVAFGDEDGWSIPQRFIEGLQQLRGEERGRAAHALGTLVAVGPDEEWPTPDSLLTQVDHTAGTAREHAARVLGYVVAFSGTGEDTNQAALIDLVQQADGVAYTRLAAALGYLAAVAEPTDQPLPQAFCDQIRHAERNTRLPQAGGYIIAQEDEADQPLSQTLTERVQETVGLERRRAAEALGFWLVLGPKTDQSGPENLVAHIRTMDGEHRGHAAEALGYLYAFGDEDDGPALESLSERVRHAHGDECSRAAQALGHLAVFVHEDRWAVPQAYRAHVRQSDSPERAYAAEALGRVVAVGDSDDHLITQNVIAHVRETEGEERRRAAEAIGRVLAFGDKHVQSLPQAFIEHIQRTEHGERRRAAEALGRVIVFVGGCEGPTKAACIAYLQRANGDERMRAAEALGYLVVFGDEDQSIPQGIIDQFHQATGGERWRIAQALGRIVAVRTEDDWPGLQALTDQVNRVAEQRITNPALERKRAAQLLGYLVAAGDSEDWLVPQALVTDIQHAEGEVRQQAAETLGYLVTGEFEALVQTAVTRSTSPNQAASFTTVDTVTPSAVLSALRTLSFTETATEIPAYLEANEPGRRQLLAILAAGLAEGTHPTYPDLRQAVETFLTSYRTAPTATRLVAVEILTALEEAT